MSMLFCDAQRHLSRDFFCDRSDKDRSQAGSRREPDWTLGVEELMKVTKAILAQPLISPVARMRHSGATNTTGQIKGEVREIAIRGTRISGAAAAIASNTQAVDRLRGFNDNGIQAGFSLPALQEEKRQPSRGSPTKVTA
jgi:hypothetical protein